MNLLPSSATGFVQLYDSTSKSFQNYPGSTTEKPIVNLVGPFAYFLSTVNVDRLESAFVITPLARIIPSTAGTCELVIVRPLRDPSLQLDDSDARCAFAAKIWQVLGGAYDNGSHVNLRYDVHGTIGKEGGGPTVVEYIRCGGWEWIPDETDGNAHVLCTDGNVSRIQKGGRAICSAVTPKDQAGYAIYV